MASRSRRRTVSLGGACVAALVALVVGFGGGWLARKASTTTTTTPTTSPSTSASSSSTSTTAVPTSPCGGDDLSGVISMSTPAVGTVLVTIQVTNVSATACSLHGYPQLQLLSANDVRLTTTTEEGGAVFTPAAANAPPRTYRVPAGSQATFVMQFSDVPVGTEVSCPMASSVDVYPPGSVDSFNVAALLNPCDYGTIHVSPFFVGA